MKETVLLILTILTLFSSCTQDCEKVESQHDNGNKKNVYYYPDCSDTTIYKKTYYYDNGQIGSEGFVSDGIKEGIFKSWNKDGIQTAEWHMKNGVEHGHVKCWYDNGVKSKETILKQGKEDGLEKTWFENGDLASIGEYENGGQVGTWKYFEENGAWKIRNYKDKKLNGFTTEHLIDSTGKVTIVVGQYENGVEIGMWKWFDKDSTLTQTAIYKNGEATGEIIEYYSDGAIKLKGYLIDGRYDGQVKYFDRDGNLTKIEEYKKGELKNN